MREDGRSEIGSVLVVLSRNKNSEERAHSFD
jgi:hypothetical protein